MTTEEHEEASQEKPGNKWIQSLIEASPRNPIFQSVGMELLFLDAGFARLKFTAQPKFYHPGGVIQGGIITAALDAAVSYAIIAALPFGAQVATTNIHVTFLKAVTEGEYEVEGKLVRLGKRAIFGDAALYDMKGNLCATATSTMVSVGD